jgi:predicted AlkP superfamily pyrophosphatase or phosphodiesterase
MSLRLAKLRGAILGIATFLALLTCIASTLPAQDASSTPAIVKAPTKPKLVVVLVVDQMRADYVEKFGGHWTGGLRRLVDQGAWFREAAYPYAETETCVGHATISTGSLPSSHGMVLNEWWDRKSQKQVTCTEDSSVKNIGYAGSSARGGDSAANMLIPVFSDELKFQSGSGTRVVTFSLKARAAIMLGGRAGDAVTWYEPSTGGWTTSSAYPTAPFIENFVKAHPVAGDYGKKWTPLLTPSEYLYDRTAVGAVPPVGLGAAFPHPLQGAARSTAPDPTFYFQWQTSPYADTYLVHMAEEAVDKLELGRRTGTDFLGISFSSPDYVGHAFGPRSWEIQDVLAQLDRDLGELFAHLDQTVGRGNYVVALSADHGVAPISEDMQKAGLEAGWLKTEDIKAAVTKSLADNGYPNSSLAKIIGTDVYFAPGIYDRLKTQPQVLAEVIAAIERVPGVASVYQAQELENRDVTRNNIQTAEADGFLKSRSGDLLIVPAPFWPEDSSTPTRPRQYGATHGTPYYYDQHVPIFFMGYGIQPGEYFGAVTPADIAPTLASLCGITLSTHDGHVLAQAIAKPGFNPTPRGSTQAQPAGPR